MRSETRELYEIALGTIERETRNYPEPPTALSIQAARLAIELDTLAQLERIAGLLAGSSGSAGLSPRRARPDSLAPICSCNQRTDLRDGHPAMREAGRLHDGSCLLSDRSRR